MWIKRKTSSKLWVLIKLLSWWHESFPFVYFDGAAWVPLITNWRAFYLKSWTVLRNCSMTFFSHYTWRWTVDINSEQFPIAAIESFSSFSFSGFCFGLDFLLNQFSFSCFTFFATVLEAKWKKRRKLQFHVSVTFFLWRLMHFTIYCFSTSAFNSP